MPAKIAGGRSRGSSCSIRPGTSYSKSHPLIVSTSRWPGGQTIEVGNGRFYVDDLATEGSSGLLTAEFRAESSAILRLIDHEPLGYAAMIVKR